MTNKEWNEKIDRDVLSYKKQIGPSNISDLIIKRTKEMIGFLISQGVKDASEDMFLIINYDSITIENVKKGKIFFVDVYEDRYEYSINYGTCDSLEVCDEFVNFLTKKSHE